MLAPTLQSLSMNAAVTMLRPLTKRKCLPTVTVFEYLLLATPFLPDIAHACQYYKYACLTDVFLPVLFKKGKLQVTSYNVSNIINYWRKKDKSLNLSNLTHMKVDDMEGSQSFHFLPFLGHLANLTFLDVGCLIDDELLAVLGINCPKLEVFDAREGISNTVTNTGLSYLALCKKLRRVLFSMFPDQYSCFQDKVAFSGNGIALLLLSLPRLEQLMCSEYILRDALNFLYRTSCQKRTLPVKCMFLDHPEVAVCNSLMQIMPIWCPDIEVLTLYVTVGKESIVSNSLRSLTKLKILVISMAAEYNCSRFEFSNFGSQLVYLQLTARLIGSHDIIRVSESCPNLKTLGLKMFSFGFDALVSHSIGLSLFPSVERLELQQNISVRLFKLLNVCMKNLKEVHCGCAIIHELAGALHVIVTAGGWKNTTLLVLPVMKQVSLTVAKMLAEVLPSIRCLSVTLSQEEEEEMNLYLLHNLTHITLVDQDLITSPSNSGIFASTMWTAELKK